MNRVGAGAAGYTVVETMIFLAISSLMIITAIMFMNGQQRKNEFATGIRDLQSQLTDIMNDVSTGFYNKTTSFSCTSADDETAPYERPSIGGGSPELGSNAGCTYVGRVIQFAPSDAGYGNETARIYTLIGRRQIGTGVRRTDVRTVAEAAPNILDTADTTLKLPYGIKIEKITYGGTPTGSVAFVSKFAGNTGSGGITGTQDIQLIPINGTGLVGYDISSTKTAIKNALITTLPSVTDGIKLCFKSGGTNQYGIIHIGGPARQASTQLTIGSGACPATL